MLNAKAFANASTLVLLAVYVVCRVVSLVAPDFLFSIAKSWFHTISVDSLRGISQWIWGHFYSEG